jgi:hypothetical protein
MLTYEIRVQGRLSRRQLAELEERDLVPCGEPVQTVLRGPVEDQSALHGLLRLLESLGLELVDVRRAAGTDLGAAEPGEGLPRLPGGGTGDVPTS